MRIISCNISNYGKLHNLNIDFSEGINSFCHDNGWGKTTLCSFIKVMLFGFDDEGKTSVLNERNHYLPLQGGSYGGSLTIEVKGKRYEIRKEFTAKKNSCVFSLYDADTGLPSNDYSENIGEEIFDIDMDSFKKSLFISQNSCQYKATDKITAKINQMINGNMSADNSEADIENYDKLADTFKSLINSNSDKRATGNLSKIKNQISDLKVKVGDRRVIEDKQNNLVVNLAKNSENSKKVEEELEGLNIRLKKLSDYKDKLAGKIKYENILAEYNTKKSEYEKIRNYFPVRVPELQEIDATIKNITDMNLLEAKIDNYKEAIRVNKPEEQKEDKKRLDELAFYYEGEKYNDGDTSLYMRAWGDRRDIKSSLPINKASLGDMKRRQEQEQETLLKQKKTKAVLFVLFAFVLIVAAIVCKNNFPLMIVCGLAGVILSVMAILSLLAKVKVIENESINELERQINDDEDYIAETERNVGEYIESFGITFEETIALEQLFEIRAMWNEYNNLHRRLAEEQGETRERQNKFQENQIELAEMKANVKKYMEEIGISPESDLLLQFHDIKNKAERYPMIKAQYDDALIIKKEFEEQNPDYNNLLSLVEEDSAESVSELENQNQHLSQFLRGLDSERKEIEIALLELSKKMQEIEKAEIILAELTDIYDEGVRKLRLLEKTEKYMSLAKTNLMNKFTAPVKNAFDKYYSMLAEEIEGEYSIDASMNISVDAVSKKISTEYLSQGYQDLVGLCMRLSLIDAMYDEEKPFIILDDPFTNLDQDKVNKGKKFINELSDSYQILYFTCNEDRAWVDV